MKKENNKMNCHSQVSLLGISTLVKQSGGDPRLQASGMTNKKINCHAELDSASSTHSVSQQQAWKILKINQTLYYNLTGRGQAVKAAVWNDTLLNRGFTLLEILIAVVIIAVLATIAVSAYQKTVLKSRFSAVIPPTKTTAEAQEFHYMREGAYATDTEDLDVKLNNGSNTITVSDKRTYKYVMGTPNNAENNHYIVYQKHSKRFAGDIHCEAHKDDARANWLCAESLGGTLLTGSISGSDWLTYLLSGEGNGKFIREDCPAWQYDDNGTCTPAPLGHYVDDGELKACSAGTFRSYSPYDRECYPCQGQRVSQEGAASCTPCSLGTVANEDKSACQKCPAGTFRGYSPYDKECYPCQGQSISQGGASSCTTCGLGTVANEDKSACQKCPAGTFRGYSPYDKECYPCQGNRISQEGASSCTVCPSGTTANSDHTACI